MDNRNYYCQKHPSHKQSKGVCPYCLRDKLSHLSTSSSSPTTINLSNFSTTSLSPCSPPISSDHHLSSSKREIKEPLKKSRSLAFVMKEEEMEEEKEKKKRRKFWSKLMGRRKDEGDGGLMHSKTMKEKSSNKRVVFS